MRSSFSCLSILLIACSLREGFSAAQTDPLSGTVIADFEGTLNVATLTCNVTTSVGTPIPTSWSVEDFRGTSGVQAVLESLAPELFLLSGDPLPPAVNSMNQLTIVNLTSELDGVSVFCGSGAMPQQATFFLRVYRPPSLRDNFVVRMEENRFSDVPIDLQQEPAAFPEPTLFQWMKDGEMLTSSNGISLTFSNVTFQSIARENSGNYSVLATNFVTDSSEQVGNDTGSFYLDVIYGPTFSDRGPTQRYALLSESLSLICGTGLDSNPPANVTWTAPDGTIIVDNARYDLENRPEIVRLNFTHTILNDSGVWTCNVKVESEQYFLNDGNLIRIDPSVIGTQISQYIQLTIIAHPGQPHTLSVENTEATSIRVCWVVPFTIDSPISYYLVSARNLNSTSVDVTVANTTNNDTFVTVTGLLPGTTYELTVVAVSRGGDIVANSTPSDPITETTGETVPAPACVYALSRGGNITSRWSYNHTGGSSITAVTVFYTYTEGQTVNRMPVPNTNAATTSVEVPNLVAGFEYTFNVTVENNIGPSSILCGPIAHNIGRPRSPEVGELSSGPGAGEVTIMIKTVASGLSDSDRGFKFVLTPVLNNIELETKSYPFPEYTSGEFETIVVTDLEEGMFYTFSATAMNSLGSSGLANSAQVQAGGFRTNPTPGRSDSGAIIGGVVGSLLIVLIIVIVVVIVIVFLRFSGTGRGDYRPNKIEGGEYHLAPSSEPTVKVQEVPSVDIGEEMTKTKPDADNEIQYAELDNFRAQSRPKNEVEEAKPVQPEEPVEYAVITSFKKVDDPADSSVPAPTSPSADNDADDKTGTSTTLV